MLFVVILTLASLYPKFPGQTGPPAWSEGSQLCPFTSQPRSCWVTQLSGVLTNPSSQMGLGATLCSGWSYVSLASAWEGLRRPISENFHIFLKWLSGQEGPGAIICSKLGYSSALLPGHGQTRCRAGRTLPLGAQVKQTCTLGTSWSDCTTWLCTWAKLLVGTTAWALQVKCQINHINQLHSF